MAITLFNPTNEDFEAIYGGVKFTIPAFPKEGHMVRVEDAKGNHILNQLGPRGLTSLDYGDEGAVKKQKAEDSVKRNLEFKKKQVIRYNQDNEARKATQRVYIDPPEQIREYAKELGIGLLAPYELQDIKNEEIAALKKDKEERERENIELRDQIRELMNTVTGLVGKIEVLEKSPKQIEDEKLAAEIEDQIRSFKGMNRMIFRPTVENLGVENYKELPIQVQQFLIERWGGFFEKEEAPFPY